ncbi:MAG: histidine--tRNA ligase [Thermodesulfovibrionales bacterium]|nr:histidine--tRNA ligase [Thermodesulfovibrionales bacterium]
MTKKGIKKVLVKYNRLKGFCDIIPPDIHIWHTVEQIIIDKLKQYGYEEMRLPIVESTDLFYRGIGEGTDIVEKEMYTFNDRAGRSLTLRPEGTASAVRAYLENQLFNRPAPQRFFYYGPMFRYERPQKGRLRQFYQIGVEAFGIGASSLDAEMLFMARSILDAIGLDSLTTEINSIGCSACRPNFIKLLKDYYRDKLDKLCADCKRRYDKNPLRILDCKVPNCVELKNEAPAIRHCLCQDCKGHFEMLIRYIEEYGLSFQINDRLVRGFDYYTKTAFEITTDKLGAQNAVLAGGRYDYLVEQFGGTNTPAIGFAIGMERIVDLIKDRINMSNPLRIFICHLGDETFIHAQKIADEIRRYNIVAETNHGSTSLKNQIRRADRLGARYVLILGSDELKANKIKWKDLQTGSQYEGALDEFVRHLCIER